ncbi:MAG TPA: protein kinase [Polyangiales bacterium]|nr:protein kinase [Polyangiales bacterium]
MPRSADSFVPIGADGVELVAGRYRLERKLARGGMGEVFAAVDQSTGTRLALKRMRPETRLQRAWVVHFMREYHSLSELRHPRIIDVYDYGVDRDVPYYTMELLDGQDLGELSPVPYVEACSYLRDVASSLALLHARRLLHRDLSPRNVRRTSNGRCKLLDFGAMVPFGIPPNLTGTAPFIAPEALQGGPLDQRADLYSLGALAYSVLTGRHAYAVRDIAELPDAWKRPCVNPRRIVRELPDALEALVMALLSLDPSKRPSSAAEIIERLSAAAELEPEDGANVARSFLSGSRLVAREAECAQLQQRLADTAAGAGSATLLSGESGSGRSRMLAEAALLAQLSGLTVVRAVARKQRGAASALLSDLLLGVHQAAPREAAAASERRPFASARLASADSGDARERVQLLAQVSEFFAEVSRARPLLIAIDDLDRADELSGALVAALAYQTQGAPLSIIASYDSRRAPPTLANVRGLAAVIPLGALDRVQTAGLVESLFGDVPNLERVSDWLYGVAAGSPKLTLELAEHLLNRGIVRYVDGTWVLPPEIGEALPPSTAAALMLRFEAVSAAARSLAEILCVARAGAGAEQLLDLAGQPVNVVFGALEELVRAGILESAGDEYAFAQHGLRKALAESLDAARLRQLHELWAERLLAEPPTRDRQLEAGWHLVHTEQELRGADLLAKIGPELIERRIGMAAAVPAVERALEVYERHGRPLAHCLRLRALLVMSSYLFDYRLAQRYADATLEAVYPYTGLAQVEWLTPRVGRHLGFALGMLWANLRWCLRPSRARGPHVFAALKYYALSAMGLAGLRALAVDVAGVNDVLERVRGFEASPHPTLSVMHTLVRAIALHNQGRGAESEDLLQAVIAQLGPERRLPVQMSEQERLDLLSGVLLLRGINECYRERSRALESAEQLERIGSPLAVAAALRIRMTYHIQRGDRERTQHYRRQLDVIAIQNGNLWQVEWIALPIEGIAGATWTDLVLLRRSLDALQRLALEVPSFAGMRDAVAVMYSFRRGDYAAAVKLGEEYMRMHAPFTLIGWAAVYAMTALACLELGRGQRALSICEQAFAPLTERHLKYVVHYTTLEAARAAAFAAVGDHARAEQLFSELMTRLRAAGEHTRACLMHEYRIDVARSRGDRPALLAALVDIREAALESRNPTVIVLADRLAAHREARSSPLPPPLGAAQQTQQQSETAMTVFLRQEKQPEDRARNALYMLGQYANTDEGFLFWSRDGRLQLAASLDGSAPSAALEFALAGVPANDGSSLRLVSGEDGFRVYRLMDERSACVGLLVLREVDGVNLSVPSSVLAELGRLPVQRA